MKIKPLPGVRKKTAKGKDYFYYATGQKDARGREILTKLPHTSDPTFARAYAAAKAGKTRRTAEKPVVMTVRRMLDLWEKSPQWKELAATTRRSYSHYGDLIREEFGDAPADDVDPIKDTQVLMDQMADRPGAANQTLRTLGAAYAWGRKRGHTTANPVRGIDQFEGGEHEPWPEWLLDAALASDDKRVQLATALLYYTAQRIGDVCAMRWTDIKDGWVSGVQEKTDKPFDVRMHSDLVAILEETPRRGFTILAQADGRPYNRKTIREALQAFARSQGAKIVPHGLRKNAVCALLEAGCSAAEAAAISEQTLQLVEHYAKRRDKKVLGSAAVLKWEGKKR